jgi:hypothetical protein
MKEIIKKSKRMKIKMNNLLNLKNRLSPIKKIIISKSKISKKKIINMKMRLCFNFKNAFTHLSSINMKTINRILSFNHDQSK